jgi:cytoskeletal protein RodZ
MPETIGQRLKKAREYRNLTLEKVEAATHIRSQFLQALEADDYSAMPSPVQARGFLRNYAQYLELDLDQMIDELRSMRPDPETETGIIFEGEQAQPSPEPDVSEAESETEITSEPFWRTWLRRVRQEAGLSDENTTVQLNLEPASEIEEEALSTPEGDFAERAGTSGESEASDEETGGEPHSKSRASLLDGLTTGFLRKQKDVPPTVEIEAKPENGEEPDTDTEPLPSSQKIINEIGQQLRQRREMLSLTLDEIERHTRMRAQFMDALEKGEFDKLPSPVQTRGLLSNYAEFLDLDVNALLLRFADALQARRRERHPENPAKRRGQPDIPEKLPMLRSIIAGDMVFGVGMVLLLIGFSVWGISRVIALQSEQRAEVQVEATGLSISEALIGTPVEAVVSEVTLIPAEDTPIPELPEGTVEIPTPAANVNVQVNIIAVERSYLQVIVDGEEVFNGRTIPGNAYPFEAEQSIEIVAGNGAALRVVYNQRDLGLLGGFGQIARFIYTADEIQVPTPVIPPTATNTPFISPTPSVTASPTPTALPEVDVQ